MDRYGPTVDVPHILETYRKFGLKQYPETAETILADGHEIGHHGYLHENPVNLSDGQQRYWLERGLAAHEKICGRLPQCYRAPAYDITPATVDLLVEHCIFYESSMMADEIPYRLQTGKGSLWEIPVHWGGAATTDRPSPTSRRSAT